MRAAQLGARGRRRVRVTTDSVRVALGRLPAHVRGAARLVFTAHSIPTQMAEACRYREQLLESGGDCRESRGC